MNIKFDINLEPFIEKTEPIYNQYLEKLPDWVSEAVEDIRLNAECF